MSPPSRALGCPLALLLACSHRPAPAAAPGGAAEPSAPAAPAAAGAPSGLRLSRTVRPTHYTADLLVRPTDDHFDGAIDIDLAVDEPTATVWMHGADLTVLSAEFRRGGERLAAQAVPGAGERLGFRAERPLPAGPVRLHVSYRGPISDHDVRGLFREKEGDDWYAYTQFEAIDARRAFPCFDEPSFKVPWQLTLRVPAGDVALSNTPIVSEAAAPGGLRTVRFAETRPLPSYLVALAVGPFELVAAGHAGQKRFPIRIAAFRGGKERARYAARTTPALLDELEGYFGIPYPYEKLDLVPIPQTAWFGAMENAGMITYVQSGMLARPEEETPRFVRGFASTMTHESAHQWFGDLVTTAWWDDVWLNEAFATWMTNKVLAKWKPEWHTALDALDGTEGAMGEDALASARQIRQPIESQHDIQNSFDAITYQKGAAVLKSFELFLGPEIFQKGVRLYLTRHAYGNATAADFVGAVGAAAGRDIAPAFASFLDQPGVPEVSATLSCPPGRPPRLELAQGRYAPVGAPKTAERAPIWHIPVCARYPTGKTIGRACTLLEAPRGELALPGAASCPAWVLPNADAAGYYRVHFTAAQAEALRKALPQLAPAERIALAEDLRAGFEAGELGAAEALGALPVLVADKNPLVWRAALRRGRFLPRILIDPALAPHYARFVAKVLGPRARALGWLPKKGEDMDTRLVHAQLVALVADSGADPALVAEARQLAERWLGDRRAVPPDFVGPVLGVAAQKGDRALFDRLVAELRKTRDDNDRNHLVDALASFEDPALVKASIELLTSGALDIRQALRLLFVNLRASAAAWEVIKQHFDDLAARLPRNFSGRLARTAEGFCDEAHRADVAAFFHDRAARLVGGPRAVRQTIESISLCIALKKAQEQGLLAFFGKY